MDNPEEVLELVRSIEEKMEVQAKHLRTIKVHAVLAKYGLIVEDIEHYKLYRPTPMKNGKLIVKVKDSDGSKTNKVSVPVYDRVSYKDNEVDCSLLKLINIV